MRLPWLLGVRGKFRSDDIADESYKFRGLGVFLFFAQAHLRHLVFNNGRYLPQRTLSRGSRYRFKGPNRLNARPGCACHKATFPAITTYSKISKKAQDLQPSPMGSRPPGLGGWASAFAPERMWDELPKITLKSPEKPESYSADGR
jgi:hypothetical protein